MSNAPGPVPHTIAYLGRYCLHLLAAAAVLGLLTACGSGDSGPGSNFGVPPPKASATCGADLSALRQFVYVSTRGVDAAGCGQTTAAPADNWQYLDMAVEYTGFIYVLAYRADTFEYQMNIYHPAQSGTAPISTTSGVNAARLTVDFWRSVYTLNYEVLQLPGGAPAGLTEPSVSLWVPT